MAWTSPLKLSALPLVLAGPILRKVTEDAVTVWFTLRQAATVTVTVTASGATGATLTGTGDTCAIGTNLHIVAVTANKIVAPNPAGAKLSSGTVYLYDASFAVSGKPVVNLLQATTVPGKTPDPNLAYLAYPPHKLPSFSLPPGDIDKLRLITGSCRHPNGSGGPDCLAMLDDLIRQTAADADLRPHQLFMGGDQIYADDVGGNLLMALTAASDLLLGWSEKLPKQGRFPGGLVSQIPPYARGPIADDAGLTSADASSHLFTLGEYICMYLFVWSDVLWTADTLPTIKDIQDKITSVFKNGILIRQDIKSVTEFRKTIPNVRRALANIPSYMILDDHDVTDDLNMTPDFCKDVYSNDLGLRIVQNALVAYTLCQHWGNAPETFFTSSTAPANTVFSGTGPGRTLLSTLNGVNDVTYVNDANTSIIRRMVGIHKYSEMKAPPVAVVGAARASWLSAYHDPDGLVFDYVVTSPIHQVIVTDTRTWRSFPPGQQHSELLPVDQIQRQIAQAKPDTGFRSLVVLVTTNAPPVPSIRQAANSPKLTAFLSAATTSEIDNHPDVFEAWELPSRPFDRLMGAIATRLPSVNKVRTGHAMILSGDVHSSFATRLLIRGINPFSNPSTPEQVNVVIAQAVASSFRNKTSTTESQGKQGYSYPSALLIGTGGPEGYFGWNLPDTAQLTVGFTVTDTLAPFLGTVSVVDDFTITGPRTLSLALMEPKHGFGSSGIVVQPHYQYRFDYLRARKEHAIPAFTTSSLPPMPPGPPTDATRVERAEIFRLISGNFREYDRSDGADRQMVGVNNISELSFDGFGTAFHAVRWFNNTAPKGAPPVMTPTVSTYEIGLNPNDTNNPLNNLSAVIPAVVTKPKGSHS